MLCRHVFGKISSEFRGISRVFVNFADLLGIRGSATARNIRSPGNTYLLLTDFDRRHREFKKQLRRCRRQRGLKNEFIFYLRIWDTLKSFTFFITVKAITKLNLGHRDNISLALVVHVLQTTENLVISHCCFAEDDNEMYKDL